MQTLLPTQDPTYLDPYFKAKDLFLPVLIKFVFQIPGVKFLYYLTKYICLLNFIVIAEQAHGWVFNKLFKMSIWWFHGCRGWW